MKKTDFVDGYRRLARTVLCAVALLLGVTAQAQEVVVVEDLASYTGTDAYVFNQKDGKTYARNNLGNYELYGVFEKVNTLTVNDPTAAERETEYLKSANDAYIDLGYVPKRNTRIETVFKAEEGPDWKALYGTRFEANTQNDVEFPGTANFPAGNGWKHGFAFFPTNGAMNLGGEVVDKGKMVFGEKILAIQSATDGTLEIYTDEASDFSELASTYQDTPLTADCETPLYIFAINKHLPVIEGYNDDPNRFGSNGDLCISPYVSLYSMKIYEGDAEDPIYDLVPVIINGKGALKDKVSGTVFNSVNGADFEIDPNAGITVYEGKMVIYNDHIYKYSDGAFTDQGAITRTPLDGEEYKNLNTWQTTGDHTGVFEGKIAYTEADGTNVIDNYEGTGGYEPLWTTVDVEANALYNFSFDFSCSEWWSWNSDEKMKAFVFSQDDFGITNNGYEANGGQTLGSFQLPTAATTDLPVSIDFTPTGNTATLIYQFGYVDDGAHGFSFAFNNLNVSKVVYPAEYPSLNPFGPQLALLIPEVEAYEGTTTTALQNALDVAVSEAQDALDNGDLADQKAALETLQEAFSNAKAVNGDMLDILDQAIQLAKNDGATVSAEAEAFKTDGTEVDAYNNVLKQVRDERKVANIEKETATFAGNDPAEGLFYLYNVGRKAYLTNGSDWGAHAALGWPGLEATLAASGDGYTIQFNELIQGDARDKYLGGSPYVDCANDAKDTYVFEPVDGKAGVYAVRGSRGYLAFDSNGEVDGGGIKHYNTVTATWATPGNTDAEWMLIKKSDRLADELLDAATEENPVDVTVVIRDASFNKYAALDTPWGEGLNQGWEWGNRDFGDKNTESFNSQEYSIEQEISVPRAGWYELTVQTYYRDGDFDSHIQKVQNGEQLTKAPLLYAANADTPVMYIHEEADKAPGEGTDTEIGNFPNNMIEASMFFENGLYKTRLIFEVDESSKSGFPIGIDKPAQDYDTDESIEYPTDNWMVTDNFRLKYLGTEEPTGIESVKTVQDEAAIKTKNAIYSITGQKLSRPQRGINIINGQKVVIK